jgi:hypothetical protein
MTDHADEAAAQDAVLWQVMEQTAADLAMHHVASRTGLDCEPIAAAMYRRLEDQGAQALARLVVLMVHKTGSATSLANEMLRQARAGAPSPDQIEAWARAGATT